MKIDNSGSRHYSLHFNITFFCGNVILEYKGLLPINYLLVIPYEQQNKVEAMSTSHVYNMEYVGTCPKVLCRC